MPFFRKIPLTVEAHEWTGENWPTMLRFLGAGGAIASTLDGQLHIDTREGEMTASPGDMIIKGVAGEFYPCKPDIFAQSYEEVR